MATDSPGQKRPTPVEHRRLEKGRAEGFLVVRQGDHEMVEKLIVVLLVGNRFDIHLCPHAIEDMVHITFVGTEADVEAFVKSVLDGTSGIDQGLDN